jgi:hypothetical protein
MFVVLCKSYKETIQKIHKAQIHFETSNLISCEKTHFKICLSEIWQVKNLKKTFKIVNSPNTSFADVLVIWLRCDSQLHGVHNTQQTVHI